MVHDLLHAFVSVLLSHYIPAFEIRFSLDICFNAISISVQLNSTHVFVCYQGRVRPNIVKKAARQVVEKYYGRYAPFLHHDRKSISFICCLLCNPQSTI
jgi:hypothetical protein